MRLTLWYGIAFLLASTAVILIIYLPIAHDRPPATFSGSSASTSSSTSPQDVRAALDEQRRTLERENLDRLLTQSLVAQAVAFVIAFGVGWLMAGRALAPVHRITATARRVADDSLHERIQLSGRRDEFKELADTFDAMLERLDRAFDGQHRFVANASHELRTSLALNRAVVEFAHSDPTAAAEVRQLTEQLLLINARQERLIDGLLMLARSEAELATVRPVDLTDLVNAAADQLAADARDARVTVRTTAEPVVVSGDPVLLEQLVLNLVRNAIQHNHAGGRVTIRTWSGTGRGHLAVTNTGPTVSGADIPRLFEPFERGGATRTGSASGAGLGLSIVQAIADAHHGAIETTPRTGGGLSVHVLLPLGPT